MELKGHLGSVTFDGQAVVITKKARGSVTIPVGSVASVQILPAGLGMRGIKFTVSGGSDSGPVMAGGSHKDLAMDPYALTFRKKQEGEFSCLMQQVLAAKASA